MKTSVVLLALATAALAAPALHEEALDEVHIPVKFLDAFTRERKSTNEASPSPGTPVDLPASQISEFGVSERSFNLKKPIIIKKRVGSSYQVYRDSDEEKLDSPEPCRKQVRVKLCDEHSVSKSANMMKSSNVEDPNMQITENDMKHSIMLAKEAVENFQNDLRKIEHKPTKSDHFKHEDSESDAELHQDIEVARQALEHIHNNFGITDNTHEVTLKEAEMVDDVALPLAQTEDERLAQWKDAIDNIHRNVELVRNLEESFKSSHNSMPHTEEVPSTKDINKHELVTKEDMRLTKNVDTKEEHKPTIENLEHAKLEKSSEHNQMKTDLADKDMLESASMVSTSKLQNLNHDDKARLTSESQVKGEHITKAKDALEELHNEQHAINTMTLDTPQNMDTLALKVAGEVKEGKTESEDLEKAKKTTVLEKSLFEHQRDAVKELHDATAFMKFKHDEKDKQMEKTEAKMIEMKAAEHITGKHSKLTKDEDKIHDEHNTMAQLKQANGFVTEDVNLDTPSQLMTDMKTHESMVQDHTFVEGKKAPNENAMLVKSDSMAIDQHKPTTGHAFEMKSAEDAKQMHQHLIDHSHMRWAQDKQLKTEMGLMKAAETQRVMDHSKHMHTVHHHGHPHAPLSHSHLRPHEHFVPHGKSADMDNTMQNYYMSMRDTDNMEQEGHRFKWRPTHQHESARTAYGSVGPASAPAAGAVGLFPNANVGSCGIPLLLSCNPSVVSGSLAKAHPAPYSAPAYRAEDNFNFHSKRDVKKADHLVNSLNRAPTNSILKTSSVLVANH